MFCRVCSQILAEKIFLFALAGRRTRDLQKGYVWRANQIHRPDVIEFDPIQASIIHMMQLFNNQSGQVKLFQLNIKKILDIIM